MALLTATTVIVARRSHLAEMDLVRAVGALARGAPNAVGTLEALARDSPGSTVAQASAALAMVAERRGDLVAARAHVDAGIAAAHRTETTRSVLSLGVLPDLVAARAFLLAASGDPDAADAEMAELAEGCPSYPYMARAELRVGVVCCARRGDLAGAGEMAASASATIPCPCRDETMMNVARAVGRPDTVGAAERDRLRRELRSDPELARWLRAVAPSLLEAFEDAPVTTAKAEETAAQAMIDDADAEAEAEALAEAASEAAALLPRAHV